MVLPLQAHAQYVSKTITLNLVHALHVLIVCMHLLIQATQLHASVVLTTTVRLVALVTPPENVPFVSPLSIFPQVVVWLATTPTVMFALELEPENVLHALLTIT